MAALIAIAIAGVVASADHPEAAVVRCLQPFLDSGQLKKVVVDRVERHYRLIVFPIDGDTAQVTLLVTARAAIRLQLSPQPGEGTMELAVRLATVAPNAPGSGPGWLPDRLRQRAREGLPGRIPQAARYCRRA